MTIKFHPAPENLLSCAAGSMPEALAAVMASHMAMCPRCRHELAVFDKVGATLLEEMPPETVGTAPALPGSAPVAATGGAQHVEHGDVPEPLRAAVGPRLDRIKWRRLAPGVWFHTVSLSEHSKASLRFIRVAPGLQLPDHGHSGSELTLVLQGAFNDAFGSYGVGDVLEMDEGIEHSPVAAPGGDCICLIASEGPARYNGFLARLVQKLTGI
ncbi:ChrR family anti-sigma-E factor [Hyphomicrobium sp.]|uniref:ChrR family anti-sigma-E factor n=1 Tax=Hyphomicrobium sp. TaxID=82 RepID=UPI000FAF4964|nr:ChrR family anti-sigma-E factor [Hyphomicrobium sp.]RUO98147.1 MAG: hypothetical protein EKK30_15660 [Hyphomicrobium sp.]